MNSKVIMGTSLAAVFVFAMMANPVFATSASHYISTVGPDFTMKVGDTPGKTSDGHAVLVYAFFTDTDGVADNSFVVYVAAVHPSFNDDPTEQTPGNKKIHAHYLELDKDTLCVSDISNGPTVAISATNDITISGTSGETVTNYVVAGYDVTSGGLCPTQVYAFI